MLYSAEKSLAHDDRAVRVVLVQAERVVPRVGAPPTSLGSGRRCSMHASQAHGRARGPVAAAHAARPPPSAAVRQARQHSSASVDRMRVVRVGKASAGSSPVKTIPAHRALRRMVRPRGAYAPRRCTRGSFRMLRRLQRRVPRPSSARIDRRCHRSSRPAFATLSPTLSAQIVEESRAAPSASLIAQGERAKAAGVGHGQLGAEVVVAELCASEGGPLI